MNAEESTHDVAVIATRRRRAPSGMTLVEIMVVIAILGLIAASVAVAVIPQLDRARRDRAELDIRNLEAALKTYYARTGAFPDTGAGLRALVDAQVLERVPKDPWDREYVYVLEGGKPSLTSYAHDGAEGGEGANADVSNRGAN